MICVTGANGVLYTSSGKRTITAWDTEKGTKREFKGHEQVISCLEIHDNILYSGSHDKTIYIWNVLVSLYNISTNSHLDRTTYFDSTRSCWRYSEHRY